MRTASRVLAVTTLLLGCAPAASAQTADEVIEKYLSAVGGRAALSKLTSRSMAGTITVATPVGEFTGPIEIVNQAPNKSRTWITLDLSSAGAGQMVQDQRFDGTVGYVIDTLQGNREITGGQLENLKNGAFPNPFMNYREMGATVELGGKERVGEHDAYLLIFKPRSGAITRQYLDAGSYLPIKLVITVEVPQLGRELEQTTEFLDYREVDGVKLPFQVKGSSSVQTFTVNMTKVEHNTTIDQEIFSKPAQ